MSLQDPVIQRRLFAGLIAALLGYLYFGSTFLPFAYRVRKAEIVILQADIAERERKVNLARSKAGRLDVLKPKLAKMESDWERVERLLPGDEDMPDFLKEMSKMAAYAGVKVDFLQPASPEPGDGIDARAIEMRVTGDYHKVGRFISNIANAKRVIGTESLVLTGITDTSARKNVEGGEKKGSVEASFRAVLYMLEASHAGS